MNDNGVLNSYGYVEYAPRHEAHLTLFNFVNYCKKYGHPRFWDKEQVICDYCQQKRGENESKLYYGLSEVGAMRLL